MAEKVPIPHSHIYVVPPIGTKFLRMLDANKRHVLGFEYQKGREKEMIEYFVNHLTSMAVIFTPQEPQKPVEKEESADGS